MSVTVTPIRDYVVLAPEEPRRRTSAHLAVVDLAPPNAYAGRVVAVGPEVRDLQVGQRVLFSKLQGFEVMGQIVLTEGAVLATL